MQETECTAVMDTIPSPSPLTPPDTEEERLSWLRLLRSRRVGIATFFRLMSRHGGALGALAALPEIASAAGVDGYRVCPAEVAQAEMTTARLAGARMLTFGAPGYPARLMTLTDPPPILWALGRGELADRPAIAIVGARNASSLGTRMAKRLGADLGEAGHTVVSGLARGIDTAAHLAAIDSGTIAVMAGGVDVVYPAENAVLAQEIGENGLLVSEQPMGTQPQARHFPTRNRLISGLADAVVVVEAAAKSGSLITARDALDQGRDVMAVPGHPFDARAAGCNMLIRDGAALVRGSRDVIESLAARQPDLAPPAAQAAPAPPRPLAAAADLHRQILDRIGPSPLAEDQLIRDLGLGAADITPELVSLEMDGRIERRPGGLIARLG